MNFRLAMKFRIFLDDITMALVKNQMYSNLNPQNTIENKKQAPFEISLYSILLFIRKSSNEQIAIPDCFCCLKKNVIGRSLHKVSRFLRYNIYYCEKCKTKCKLQSRKCSRTRNMKKLHLINTVLAEKFRLPSNVHIKLKISKG